MFRQIFCAFWSRTTGRLRNAAFQRPLEIRRRIRAFGVVWRVREEKEGRRDRIEDGAVLRFGA